MGVDSFKTDFGERVTTKGGVGISIIVKLRKHF